MKKNVRRSIAAAMAIVMVGGISSVRAASAEERVLPPADRILPGTIERDVTVPNGMNVQLRDENGKLLDGAFELRDQQGAVVAAWNGNQGYQIVRPPQELNEVCRFDETGFTGNIKGILDIGDITEEVKEAYNQGWTYVQYGKTKGYTPYGNKMTEELETFTVPAGEVWIHVGEGYKRQNDGQDSAKQALVYEGKRYDLSELAGQIKKIQHDAGECRGTVDLTYDTTAKSGTLMASNRPEEYVKLTLDLHTYYPEIVNEQGKCTNYSNAVFSYGAPVVNGNDVTSACFLLTSGAVTNVVSLDENTTTATVYIRKNDYSPRITYAAAAYKDGKPEHYYQYLYDFTYDGIHDYKYQEVTISEPPVEGMNLGYLPAGTYTLHQTETAKGYELAPEQTVTIKDSYLTADFQKIVVTNEPIGAHKHTFSDQWTSDAAFHWHAATCVHSDQIKDQAAHSYGEWTVVQEPTAEASGLRERSCTVCGYIEQEVLPAGTPSQPDPAEPDKPAAPQTGDHSHIWLLGTAMLISCGGLLLLRKKKAD